MPSKLHLETALLPDGWRQDVVITVEHGTIISVEPARAAGAERISGVSVPGLPNLHSHAFQRAMAGLTERRGSGETVELHVKTPLNRCCPIPYKARRGQ